MWLWIVLAVLVVLLLAFVGAFVFASGLLNRRTALGRATIKDPEEHTTADPETGAVRSVQGADLTFPADQLDDLWTPRNLERLARTYWRFLRRVTLGVCRVRYHDDGRAVCLFGIRRLPLLTFLAPEYQMDSSRGIVRWRIDKGLLVGRRGRSGDGYLEIDVERCEPAAEDPGDARLHVEVEVANFYPALAGVAQWFYANTQSRIHVIVTHGFLHSLARLDLDESKVGRFSGTDPDPEIGPSIDDVPDPPQGGQRTGRDRTLAPR